MASYFFQEILPNEDYVFKRIGEEGRNIRKFYLENLNKTTQQSISPKDKRSFLRKILSKIKQAIKAFLFRDEIQFYQDNIQYALIGKFRLSGEIHQWMYDRYSLSKLLEETKFRDIQIKTAFESAIPNWNDFELESKNGVIFKPDSLFVEARK